MKLSYLRERGQEGSERRTEGRTVGQYGGWMGNRLLYIKRINGSTPVKSSLVKRKGSGRNPKGMIWSGVKVL